MNTELLKKVRDHILDHPEQLDMGTYVCGTTACIAGHALLLAGYERDPDDYNVLRPSNGLPLCRSGDYFDAGREVLGLDHNQACALFLNSPIDLETDAEAVATIDRLIETGFVVWYSPD